MPAFHCMAAGCGGIVHRGIQGPTDCQAEPTMAGLWYAAHGRTAWLGLPATGKRSSSSPRGRCCPATATFSTAAATAAAPRWPGNAGQASRKARWLAVLPPSGSSNAPKRGRNGTPPGSGPGRCKHPAGTHPPAHLPRGPRTTPSRPDRPRTAHGNPTGVDATSRASRTTSPRIDHRKASSCPPQSSRVGFQNACGCREPCHGL
jgi:hypothetical protein